MRFIKSILYEEMPLGDGEGCVYFDGSTGNTLVLDGIALDVLNCFETERDLEEATDMLLEKYEGERSVIQNDIKELVNRFVENGLLKKAEKETVG